MKIHVTVYKSTLYEKPQKMPFFRPKDPFIVGTPHFLGSKFEEILTNTQKEFTKFVNSETIVYLCNQMECNGY